MKALSLILTSILYVSCQNGQALKNGAIGRNSIEQSVYYSDDLEIEPPRTAEPPAPQDGKEYHSQKDKKVIKNGSMKFEVENLEKVKRQVNTILLNAEGYYENEQYNAYGSRITYTLKLRLPNIKFDSAVISLEQGIGDLQTKNINAEDVTEEYYDLTMRLENNLAYLSTYKEILETARSVKDVLEVQEKIRRIEEEVETKKGRIKYINDQVKYSSLDLELTEYISKELSDKPNFLRRVFNAFNNGIAGFLDLIITLINFWPYILLIVMLFLTRRPILKVLRRVIHQTIRS